MSHPTGPHDPGWFEWAEEQTVLRLRAQLAQRRAGSEPPAPEFVRVDDSSASSPNRVIRIHLENVETSV